MHKIYEKLFKLLFRTQYFRRTINSMISGASGRKRVQPEQLEALKGPLPPLPIQRAIVRRWEKAQKEIVEAQRRIERIEQEIPFQIYTTLEVPKPSPNDPQRKYMALWWRDLERWSFNYLARDRQGLLGFTNSRYPIVSLNQCLVDTRNGYCIKPVAGPTSHRMLKLSALTPSGLNLADSKFVKVSEKVAEHFSIRKGDLLICRSVGSHNLIAKCALVEADHTDILFPDIMIRVRLQKTVLPEYAREVIQTPLGRSYFQSNARTAVGMWKIGAEDIRNFPIPLPPLDVQEDIVQRVKQVQTEIAQEQEKARRLAAEVEREVEEMILGIQPVCGVEGL